MDCCQTISKTMDHTHDKKLLGTSSPTRVIFNGFQLPSAAIMIDLALNNQHVDVDDAESLWWWRFTICADRALSEDARLVREHADRMLAVLQGQSTQVVGVLMEKFDIAKTEAEAVLAEWVEVADVIRSIASATERCVWFGRT